jgi:hypothetical protein
MWPCHLHKKISERNKRILEILINIYIYIYIYIYILLLCAVYYMIELIEYLLFLNPLFVIGVER